MPVKARSVPCSKAMYLAIPATGRATTGGVAQTPEQAAALLLCRALYAPNPTSSPPALLNKQHLYSRPQPSAPAKWHQTQAPTPPANILPATLTRQRLRSLSPLLSGHGCDVVARAAQLPRCPWLRRRPALGAACCTAALIAHAEQGLEAVQQRCGRGGVHAAPGGDVWSEGGGAVGGGCCAAEVGPWGSARCLRAAGAEQALGRCGPHLVMRAVDTIQLLPSTTCGVKKHFPRFRRTLLIWCCKPSSWEREWRCAVSNVCSSAWRSVVRQLTRRLRSNRRLAPGFVSCAAATCLSAAGTRMRKVSQGCTRTCTRALRPAHLTPCNKAPHAPVPLPPMLERCHHAIPCHAQASGTAGAPWARGRQATPKP